MGKKVSLFGFVIKEGSVDEESLTLEAARQIAGELAHTVIITPTSASGKPIKGNQSIEKVVSSGGTEVKH